MEGLRRKFLLVDDDPLNNILSRLALENLAENIEVTDFDVPEKGLEYIQTEFEDSPDQEKTILFLDIDMPTMNGWEFLEEFEALKNPVKKQFDIYILSSSVDPRDIERANSNPLVMGFIEKPLNKTILVEMFG
jgi:response regulator RpfG family c-di-GMP phosphodiesterase